MKTNKINGINYSGWFVGEVSFDLDYKKVQFKVIHNIPHSGDINGFNGAVQNWLVRTDEYTQESLIKYINSKHIYNAYTEKQFFSKYKKNKELFLYK